MKRRNTIFYFLSIILMLLATSIIADEALMIDFSLLGADYPQDNPLHNERTLVDYSFIVRNASYTPEQRSEMKVSLAIPQWVVKLNSSARSNIADALSYTREAFVRPEAQFYPDQLVMGVRVHFPETPYNAWANVIPPFSIPSFADRDELQPDGTLLVPPEEISGGRKFDSYGVVQNVGTVRTITVAAYGLNYPHRLTLLWRNVDNELVETKMGHLEYDGWQELTWDNPNYIENVRKRDLRILPLYPETLPHIRFEGFRLYRDGNAVGGDFVTYFKDVKVTYDKAYLQIDRAIDDEGVWGIIRSRASEKARVAMERVGKNEILQYIERLKKHVVQEDLDAF